MLTLTSARNHYHSTLIDYHITALLNLLHYCTYHCGAQVENLASPHLLSPQPGYTLVCMCVCVPCLILIYYDALIHTLACLGVSSISSGMQEGEDGMWVLLQYESGLVTENSDASAYLCNCQTYQNLYLCIPANMITHNACTLTCATHTD